MLRRYSSPRVVDDSYTMEGHPWFTSVCLVGHKHELIWKCTYCLPVSHGSEVMQHDSNACIIAPSSPLLLFELPRHCLLDSYLLVSGIGSCLLRIDLLCFASPTSTLEALTGQIPARSSASLQRWLTAASEYWPSAAWKPSGT
jgi:hypothetical protein